MSSASSDMSQATGLLWQQVQNQLWRNYREQGDYANPSRTVRDNWYNDFGTGVIVPPLLPNPNTLRFFDNYLWDQNPYDAAAPSANSLVSPALADPDPDNNSRAQRRYNEVRDYFGRPRYIAQRALGYGGNGLAIHYRDRGPQNGNDPGRDIVIKVALNGDQSDSIVREREMMRKVKGSAHCVQVLDPQDIGQAEEEPVTLPLRSNPKETSKTKAEYPPK
ncbi:hypothetical protein ONZ43_g3539 [Nemania bipapillata]|uniref:Uncharacterized protein n=1 Tax=Nemania bipapillata TaxID=110536 RepID=A0ACC2IWB9_9PEZI|nr:hypothetical protein ONZ43_g3539 [Nemania bipapillata]